MVKKPISMAAFWREFRNWRMKLPFRGGLLDAGPACSRPSQVTPDCLVAWSRPPYLPGRGWPRQPRGIRLSQYPDHSRQ